MHHYNHYNITLSQRARGHPWPLHTLPIQSIPKSCLFPLSNTCQIYILSILPSILLFSLCPAFASLGAHAVKHLPEMQETQVQTLDWEDPLEKGMATHSNILACPVFGFYSICWAFQLVLQGEEEAWGLRCKTGQEKQIDQGRWWKPKSNSDLLRATDILVLSCVPTAFE